MTLASKLRGTILSEKYEQYEQDNLVVELCCGFEEMDEDEFEEKYNQLDEAHQRQVDQAASNFADGAIGDSSWREGWDCD